VGKLEIEVFAPTQAIERKVSVIVSLIMCCSGSCGVLATEDGDGGCLFSLKIGILDN